MITITKRELFEQAADSYLSAELPNNWDTMPEEEFYAFLESNVLEFYGGAVGSWLFYTIDRAASGWENFLSRHGITSG